MTSSMRLRTTLRAAGPQIRRGAIAVLLLSLPTVAIAVLVTLHWDVLIDLDQRIAVAATDLTRAHPDLRTSLLAWQIAFHPQVVYLAAVPITAVVWRCGLRACAVWGGATMMTGWGLGLLVKLVVARHRPVLEHPVSHSPGFSFPSGHAFNATLMLTVSLIMIWPLVSGRSTRVALTALAVSLSLLTALDRVYLGVHFASDVVAGILLALAVALGSFAGFIHQPQATT